jgi:DNA-binding transcriptional LysR family regulator
VTFLSTALWLAECGVAAALMPSGYAREPARHGLVVLKLTQPVVSRDISVVTRRGRSLSPAAQAFVDVLLAEYG